MDWLRDRAWQQVIAGVLVILGATLIHLGAAETGEMNATAWSGLAVFTIGMATPLVSQALHAFREGTDRDEGA